MYELYRLVNICRCQVLRQILIDGVTDWPTGLQEYRQARAAAVSSRIPQWLTLQPLLDKQWTPIEIAGGGQFRAARSVIARHRLHLNFLLFQPRVPVFRWAQSHGEADQPVSDQISSHYTRWFRESLSRTHWYTSTAQTIRFRKSPARGCENHEYLTRQE